MRTREMIRDAKALFDWEDLIQTLQNELDQALAQLETGDLDPTAFVEGIETPTGYIRAHTYDDNLTITTYIGSVFHLTPSGKYYLPFACSNVEPCPRCKGTGQVTRTEGDPDEHARVKRQRKDIVGIARALYGDYQQWPKMTQDLNHELYQIERQTDPTKTCPWCEGLGSREAYLDQVWWETLDTLLDGLGAYIQSGEGDPTDIFVGLCVDPPEPIRQAMTEDRERWRL